MDKIKKQLYEYCLAYVEQRIQTARNAIDASRESANDDTKSSAGDKYETGREMMQQEINRNQVQLNEAQKLKEILNRLSVEKSESIIRNGSLVVTNQGAFYIAVSCGQIVIDGKSYFAISSQSPIGIKFMGQKSGAAFHFNEKKFKILDVQ
ncbi:MAG: 3-oxoacyl-ACP synthase [Daejeonella sp.]